MRIISEFSVPKGRIILFIHWFHHTCKVRSETIYVKYRGTVDLETFECRDTPRSFIQRVCYDKAQSYMIINLKGTYYHYYELPRATFDGLVGAPSMGHFYNQKYQVRRLGRPIRLPNTPRSELLTLRADNGMASSWLKR